MLREEGAVLCTFRDVTNERKTEIELKQTKEFFERVIDSSVDAIVSAGLDGRVLLFNRAASRVFGYEPKDVSVAILYEDGPYGTGVAAGNEARCKELGIKIVHKEGYAATSTDLSALVTKLRRAHIGFGHPAGGDDEDLIHD